jgi:hypothetical protein
MHVNSAPIEGRSAADPLSKVRLLTLASLDARTAAARAIEAIESDLGSD